MELAEVVKAEVAEALGPDNKWYCSEHFGREITNPEILICYYIKHGGPEQFRKRLSVVYTARSACPTMNRAVFR
jgi:hypothetical protein